VQLRGTRLCHFIHQVLHTTDVNHLQGNGIVMRISFYKGLQKTNGDDLNAMHATMSFVGVRVSVTEAEFCTCMHMCVRAQPHASMSMGAYVRTWVSCGQAWLRALVAVCMRGGERAWLRGYMVACQCVR